MTRRSEGLHGGEKFPTNYASGVSVWTPASLGANLRAWYKADVGVYSDAGSTPAVNNGDVKQWNDQSGNGFHLSQNLGGNYPVLKTTGFNGLPGLIFRGNFGQSNLFTTIDSVTGLNVNAHSGFAVGSYNNVSAGNYSRLVGYWGNGQANDYTNASSCSWVLRQATNDVIISYAAFGERGGGNATAASGNYRMGGVFDGANVTNYLNNSPSAGSAYNQTMSNNGTIVIGEDLTLPSTNGTASWYDYMAEIVIANIAFDSGTRTNLDNYFKARWGL